MSRTLITTGDLIVGDNHPNYPSVKNRYGKELWTAFTAEHSTTGGHLAPYNVFPIPDSGTHTGTGAAQTVPWNVTTYTSIIMLMIWSEEDGNLYFATPDSLPYTKSSADEYPTTDRVTALSSTGFTLGTSADVNDSGVTYFWAAIGLGATADAGVNDDPPAWIEAGVAMTGGDSSAMANSVEDDLDTRLQVGHTEGGVHLPTEFSGLGRAEQGTFTPTGTYGQIVPLETADLDVKGLFLLPGVRQTAFYKTEDMALMHDFSATALSSSGYLTLGTGQFTIDGTKRSPQFTLFELLSDTTDGSTTFTDTSAFAHTIAREGAVQHSTTQHHTGASSIRFNANGQSLQSAFNEGEWGDFEVILWIYTNVTSTTSIQSKPHDTIIMSLGLSLSLWITISINTDGAVMVYGIDLINRVPILVPSVTSTQPLPFQVIHNPVTGTGIAINDSAWHKIRVYSERDVINLEVDTVLQGDGRLSIPSDAVVSVGNSFWGHGFDLTFGASRYLITTADQGVGKLAYLDDITVKVTPYVFPFGKDMNYVALGE